MKKTGFLMMVAVALTAVSCSTEAEEGKEVTYTLDQTNSSINWKGGMSAEYFHTGTVQFSKGSIAMAGEELKSGSFTIDMNSIDDNSLEAPKSNYLSGHLMGTMPDEDHPVNMFFNTPDFPNATVTLGAYKEGGLEITLNVIGISITQNVDATLSVNETGASIKGSFSLDLASMNAPGFETQADGSAISSLIEFDVEVLFTK
ncbi:MAG: YceI family protein [Crocinitomicaceae bacterium]|jgi:polyisoprenoid-binding protein YceI